MDARVKSSWVRAARWVATWGLCPLYAVGAAAYAGAEEPIFGIDAGIGHSDNITRTPTDQQGTTIATVGTLFSLSESTNRFQGGLSGNLEYQHYSRNTLPGEVFGSVTARGQFVVIPERFEWKVSDDFGQTAQRQYETVTPENRENINYLSTGPLFTLALGANDRLTLEGSYSKVDYQQSDLDNQRYRGVVSIAHQLSAVSSVSLIVRSERISYRDALDDPPTDSRESVVRLQATGQRTAITVDGGYEREQHETTASSRPVFHLDASRAISPNSTLNLLVGSEFSDAGDLYKLLQERSLQSSSGGSDTTQVVQPTSEPFTNTYEILSWKLKERRSAFELAAQRFKQSYQNLSQYDQTSTAIRADFDYQFSPTLQIHTTGVLLKNVNAMEFGNTTDRNLILKLAKRVGRRLSIVFQYDRLDRAAVQEANAGRANEVWLRFYYGTSALTGGFSAPRSP